MLWRIDNTQHPKINLRPRLVNDPLRLPIEANKTYEIAELISPICAEHVATWIGPGPDYLGGTFSHGTVVLQEHPLNTQRNSQIPSQLPTLPAPALAQMSTFPKSQRFSYENPAVTPRNSRIPRFGGHNRISMESPPSIEARTPLELPSKTHELCSNLTSARSNVCYTPPPIFDLQSNAGHTPHPASTRDSTKSPDLQVISYREPSNLAGWNIPSLWDYQDAERTFGIERWVNWKYGMGKIIVVEFAYNCTRIG